jgi:hypothetical protein
MRRVRRRWLRSLLFRAELPVESIGVRNDALGPFAWVTTATPVPVANVSRLSGEHFRSDGTPPVLVHFTPAAGTPPGELLPSAP